jgi:hypothetical protein
MIFPFSYKLIQFHQPCLSYYLATHELFSFSKSDSKLWQQNSSQPKSLCTSIRSGVSRPFYAFTALQICKFAGIYRTFCILLLFRYVRLNHDVSLSGHLAHCSRRQHQLHPRHQITVIPHSLLANQLRIYRSLLAVCSSRNCALFHGSASWPCLHVAHFWLAC